MKPETQATITALSDQLMAEVGEGFANFPLEDYVIISKALYRMDDNPALFILYPPKLQKIVFRLALLGLSQAIVAAGSHIQAQGETP